MKKRPVISYSHLSLPISLLASPIFFFQLPEYLLEKSWQFARFVINLLTLLWVELTEEVGSTTFLTSEILRNLTVPLFGNFWQNPSSWPSLEMFKLTTIRDIDPIWLFVAQAIFLTSSLVLCSELRRKEKKRQSRRRGRELTPIIILSLVATIPISISLLAFPPLELTEEMGHLSNVTSDILTILPPRESELSIVVPRRSTIIKATITITPLVDTCGAPLIESISSNRTLGYPISDRFTSACRLGVNGTYALKRLSLLVGSIVESDENTSITITGTSDDGGTSLFSISVPAANMGMAAEWLDFDFNPPFLYIKGEDLWIMVSSKGGGFYVWWMTEDDEDGEVRVLEKGSGWKSVEGRPGLILYCENTYDRQILVDAGRQGVDWEGTVSLGESRTVDISNQIQDYVSLSPENFKNVSVPVRFSSDSRIVLIPSDIEVLTRIENPQVLAAIFNLFVAALASIAFTHSAVLFARF